MISTRTHVRDDWDRSNDVDVDADWLEQAQKKTEAAIEILQAARRLSADAKTGHPPTGPVEMTVVDALIEKALNLLVEAQTPW
jgi:hypothetical protein